MTTDQPLNQRQKLNQDFDDQDLVNIFTDAVEVRKAFDDFIFNNENPNSNIRLLVIWGSESVGKTTALKMCRLVCRNRGVFSALVESTNIIGTAYLTLQIKLLEAWNQYLTNEGINLNTFRVTLERYYHLDDEIRSLVRQDPQIAPIFNELNELKQPTRDPDLVATLLAGTDLNANQFKRWIRRKYSPDDAELYLNPNQIFNSSFFERSE
jgi:hypothetical protein